jgi:hypothetical protein
LGVFHTVLTIFTTYVPFSSRTDTYDHYPFARVHWRYSIQHLQNAYVPATVNRPLQFVFENTKEAAKHNSTILASFDNDIHKAILAHPNSQLSYGSEFKSTSQLEELLQDHPNWIPLKKLLQHGASFLLRPMTQEDRDVDLSYQIEHGNHQSASKHQAILGDLIAEDVRRGFALPLQLDTPKFLPNASIAPLGCIEQTSINERGDQVVKYRMTHDQSFPGPSGLSVNKRVNKDLLPPCMYSFVLSRVLHYIVSTRKNLPTTKIYKCKFDIDAAYRRCHLSHDTATECLTIHDGKLFMALRLTFGGTPCPALWGLISDTIIDTCNTLIQNHHWDHNTLFDPISELIDEPSSLPDSIPFSQAKDLMIEKPLNNRGFTDIYIDDSIGIAPDIGDTPLRVNRAIPLAIKTFARPMDTNDQLPRQEIISLKKLKAEARLAETKTVLGWDLNTRQLIISLPRDKYERWSEAIQLCEDILHILHSKEQCSRRTTHSGRLMHYRMLPPSCLYP